MVSAASELYGAVARYLKAQRRRERISQQELARQLGKPQSFVSKYENAEQYLDVAEFLMVLEALRLDPPAAMLEILKSLPGYGVRIRRRPLSFP